MRRGLNLARAPGERHHTRGDIQRTDCRGVTETLRCDGDVTVLRRRRGVTETNKARLRDGWYAVRYDELETGEGWGGSSEWMVFTTGRDSSASSIISQKGRNSSEQNTNRDGTGRGGRSQE